MDRLVKPASLTAGQSVMMAKHLDAGQMPTGGRGCDRVSTIRQQGDCSGVVRWTGSPLCGHLKAEPRSGGDANNQAPG